MLSVRSRRRLSSISARRTSGRPRPAPAYPPLVATTQPSGKGDRAAPIVSSLCPPVYRCAVSIIWIPLETAALTNSTCAGVCVSRLVPRPIRATSMSPNFSFEFICRPAGNLTSTRRTTRHNRGTPTKRALTSAARRQYSTGDRELDRRLVALIDELASDLSEPDARLAFEILVTAVRLAREPLSRLDRKLLNASLKEMRYAFGVFSKYRGRMKVSVFGSARTPASDPNYQLAVEFGRRMAEQRWMVVTGRGPGIV